MSNHASTNRAPYSAINFQKNEYLNYGEMHTLCASSVTINCHDSLGISLQSVSKIKARSLKHGLNACLSLRESPQERNKLSKAVRSVEPVAKCRLHAAPRPLSIGFNVMRALPRLLGMQNFRRDEHAAPTTTSRGHQGPKFSIPYSAPRLPQSRRRGQRS